MNYVDFFGKRSFHHHLENSFPTIPWREPIPVTTSSAKHFACRYCIAAYGLASDGLNTADFVFDDFGKCEDHIACHHPRLSYTDKRERKPFVH